MLLKLNMHRTKNQWPRIIFYSNSEQNRHMSPADSQKYWLKRTVVSVPSVLWCKNTIFKQTVCHFKVPVCWNFSCSTVFVST